MMLSADTMRWFAPQTADEAAYPLNFDEEGDEALAGPSVVAPALSGRRATEDLEKIS
jgi:hypothetical protein